MIHEYVHACAYVGTAEAHTLIETTCVHIYIYICIPIDINIYIYIYVCMYMCVKHNSTNVVWKVVCRS